VLVEPLVRESVRLVGDGDAERAARGVARVDPRNLDSSVIRSKSACQKPLIRQSVAS
jgi:hypothetical protein